MGDNRRWWKGGIFVDFITRMKWNRQFGWSCGETHIGLGIGLLGCLNEEMRWLTSTTIILHHHQTKRYEVTTKQRHLGASELMACELQAHKEFSVVIITINISPLPLPLLLRQHRRIPNSYSSSIDITTRHR